MTTDTFDNLPGKSMNRSVRFWDKIADRYAQKPVPDQEAYHKKLEMTRAYLQTDMTVIELGCGTGSTALELAPCVSQVHGTDISARMIEIAKSKAESENVSNVTFEQESIDGLGYAAQSVDAVLAHSILHLLKDKEKAIENAFQWLKPGGVFVSSTACIGDMAWYLRAILPLGNFLGLIPLVSVFGEKEFKTSLTAAGFEIEKYWQPGKGKAIFVIARKPMA